MPQRAVTRFAELVEHTWSPKMYVKVFPVTGTPST